MKEIKAQTRTELQEVLFTFQLNQEENIPNQIQGSLLLMEEYKESDGTTDESTTRPSP